MAGNMRYESNSAASPEELGFAGSYANGQKGDYTSASLDRSGSFREGSESRSFGSGASTPRATSSSSEGGSIVQYLLLDPITMGDQKYTRSGELRKVLGISIGNAAENNSFGAAHSKPPPPVATEELKRYKASISETALRARARYKRFNESLLKLNKYCEASNLKKQHRNEILISERSGTSNFMKMGIQIHRNTSDLGTQRLEERNKNVVLNKRVRSSVAELRADSRSNPLPRQQMGKDREMPRDGSEGSDLPEEKVRRMPAAGEGWDRKMKRKRSVGSVFARSTDSDGETKRVMHHKLNNEPGLQSYDGQGFSTGSLNGTSGINKLDSSSSPAFSNPRAVLKNESDKASLARDFADSVNKDRLSSKANNKLNFLEDNHTVSPSSVLKGKASRTPRTGCVTANSSPKFSRSSGAPDGWEHFPSMTKVNSFGGASNRKRTLPAGSESSSPPMAQWVGQRPQKISRTRRANVVSPVSNHDEVQTSSEGGQAYPSDFRLTSVGCNGSLLAKDTANGNQLAKVKHEKVFSPARLSESEESGAGANHEARPKEKGLVNGVDERSQNLNICTSSVLTKKNNILNREDTGDGLRRQGRTGRGASISRSNVSPVREKLESPASAKPIRNMKSVSGKNGSKSGRPPLKKILDRKSFSRGQTATGGSPDLTVDSDDDREELLAAANYACNASHLCCSSTFWKKMEPFFSSPSLEDILYLKLQLKSVKELHQSISDMSNLSSNILGDLVHQEDLKSLTFEENKKCFEEDDCPKKLADKNLTTLGLENGPSCEMLEGIDQVTPLYQRVLSALIVEDEYEEFEENDEERNLSFQNSRDWSPGNSCPSIDFEPIEDTMDFHYDSMLGLGFQTHKLSAVDGFSCNGNANINRSGSVFHNELHNDDCFRGDQAYLISKLTEFQKYLGDSDRKLSAETNASLISTLDCRFQQTCLEERLLMELQSIGLHPEKVPDLADGEDEEINQEIIELQKGFIPQVAKKKALLNEIIKTVEESKTVEAGVFEQVAMDKLVELAYKKLLATKGSYASKFGVPKVPRQVAVAFMKRTLARCRKFGDTGKSCFGEPPLRDVILAAPPGGNHTESPSFIGLSVKSSMHSGTPNSQHDPGSSGSFSSRAEQHDLHNERSGRAANASVRILTNSHDPDFAESGAPLSRGKKKELLLDDVGGNASFRPGNGLLAGTKGKRSERERDKDASARNPGTKGGRASQANTKGDRKTKSKPKQKTAYLAASGDRVSSESKDTNSNKKREAGLNSYDCNPQNLSKQNKGETEVTELQDLSVELGIGNDIEDHQDLSNLFNFDEDGLPENDLIGLDIPMDGLEIPMDDLSELNMIL